MAYKVAIDSDNNDYSLLISKYINNRLNALGIDNFLVKNNDDILTDEQRVNIIKNTYGNGNNTIVISNRSNNNAGTEIMYALRNNSRLATLLSNNIEAAGGNVLKYYQFRNSINTALDEDYIIRNTANNQTVAIDYAYDDNYEDFGEAVVKSLAEYANVTYFPVDDKTYYVVQKGDSLWSIASKYKVSVDNLKKANGLSSNNLNIGQLLKIPEKEETPISKNTYTVQKGDSLWSIANKYNTTVDNLKKINNLSNNILSIGQKLLISGNIPSNELIYTVQKGDSLWLIANKYDTTVDKIKSANNLSSNTLFIGQKLIIPSTSNYINYTVISGDSLYKIAIKYNTTINDIKKLNNLTNDVLYINQKLLIPS